MKLYIIGLLLIVSTGKLNIYAVNLYLIINMLFEI